MLEKRPNNNLKCFYILLTVLVCLGIFSIHQENYLENQSALSIKHTQLCPVKSSSILSQIPKNPQLVCALNLLSFKQKAGLSQCKKASFPFIEFLKKESLISFVLSSDFSDHFRSYQFLRLNVLSSQAHPPTAV